MERIILNEMTPDELKELIREEINEGILKLTFPPSEDKPEYINRNEVSRILGISRTTTYVWQEAGILNPYTVGTRIRFLRSEVLEALRKVKVTPEDPH